MVFGDQGYTSSGAYAIQYDREEFWDPPPKNHGGQPLSFADGHCEFHKWTDSRTKEINWDNKDDPAFCYCNQDLYWLQKVIWGKLGYEPSCPPEF
jgi:hypothetical protein